MKPYYAKVKDGHIWFGSNESEFLEFATKNPKMTYRVTAMLPESEHMRGYFEGPLVRAFAEQVYLIPKPSNEKLEQIRDEAKAYFLGVDARETPFGALTVNIKSSKGREQLTKLVENATEYLETNGYQVPNNELWKHWRDKYGTEYPDYDEWREEKGYALSDFPREND